MNILQTLGSFFSRPTRPDTDLVNKISQQQALDTIKGTNTETGIGLDLQHYSMLELIGAPDSRTERYRAFDHLDERYAEVSLALDTFADETIVIDTDKQVPFWVVSQDPKVVEQLNILFFDVLGWKNGTTLNTMTRNLCKYGDTFAELVINQTLGVVKVKELPVGSVWADFDLTGKPKRWIQRFIDSSISTTELVFQPWQVHHMKLPAKTSGQFYGNSMLIDALLPSKILEAIEMSSLLGRLNGAVKRYVYKIPVGTKSRADSTAYINEVKQSLRKKSLINTENGQFQSVNDILTAGEDFFIPTRDASQGGGIEIENLSERNRVADNIDDIKYFREKSNNALKMPTSFISQEGVLDVKSLSKSDLRFSRRIQKVQSVLREFLEAIADLHLSYTNYGIKEPFSIQLASVSQLEEQIMLENLELRYNLVGAMETFIPRQKLYTSILKFSEAETKELLEMLDKQKLEDARKESISQAEAQIASMEAMKRAGHEVDNVAMEQIKELINTSPAFRLAVENLKVLGKDYLDAKNQSKKALDKGSL